jgi:hypothetical protein
MFLHSRIPIMKLFNFEIVCSEFYLPIHTTNKVLATATIAVNITFILKIVRAFLERIF